jgi:hypothetical protein
MSNQPSRGYVHYITVGRPWHEEMSLWRDRECEPRHVVPMLVKAFEFLKQSDFKEGLGRAGLASSALVHQDPTHWLFHGRDVRYTEVDGEPPAIPAHFTTPGTNKNPLSDATTFFYRVWLINPVKSGDKDYRPWEVEILQTNAKFEKEQKIENMTVVHKRQPLPKLAEVIQRLANYASVGGTPEEVY